MDSVQTANGAAQEKKGHFMFFKHSHENRAKPSKRPSVSHRTSDSHKADKKSSSLISLDDLRGTLSDSVIESEFSSLGTSIESHVRKFYQGGQRKDVTQFAVEHATTGLSIPWLTVLGLLGQEDTRMRAICLCISWTLLSRSLLLKLGLSSSPGSTFLPPEIVECFQSFSSVLSGPMLGGVDSQEGVQPFPFACQSAAISITSLVSARDESVALAGAIDVCKPHFALLSRWKQISAILMHNTYVRDAFSHFDSRTINIERAINDLDPLLRAYASADPRDNEARLADLRDILRQGAKFAFLLFSQPCFWQFDWKEQSRRGKEKMVVGGENPVIWPRLQRVMNGEGMSVEVMEVLGRKKFLRDGGR